MTEIDNLALDRIECLVSMAKAHGKAGDNATREFLLGEAKILAMVLDGAGDVFHARYHRYSSESFGVVFEINHGDPELIFGGV